MGAGERTVRIKFDGSTKGLAQAAVTARAELDLMRKSLERNQAELNRLAGAAEASNQKFSQTAQTIEDSRTRWQRFGLALSAAGKRFAASRDKIVSGTAPLVSGIGSVAGSFATMARQASTAAGVLNLLPVAVNGIAAAAGVLPLAVAGGFALAGAMIAAKLGADGAKAAFKQLDPQLNTLKSGVSASFKDALLPAVHNLQTLLPKTETGFRSVATAMGGVVTKVTSYLATAKGTAQVNQILDGTSRLIQNLGSFFAPVIAAFLQIGAVAMPILVQLTGGLGAAGERFRAFVQQAAESGQLQEWSRSAIAGFQSFFAVIKDLAAIFNAVVGAIMDAGGGLGGFLGPLIKTVREFLESAQGHDTLVAFFESLNSVAGSVSKVVGALLAAIAPAIPPLAAAFASLASTLSTMLVPVIQFLAPVLQNIANFIAQNTSWIAPLVVALGLWAAAQWVLNAAMDANPIGLVIIAIGALIAIVATIITYWEPIKTFFVDLWNTVKDAVAAAAQWIWQRLVDAWNFIKGVWSGVGDFFAGLWEGVKQRASTIWEFIKGVFSGAWDRIKSVWSGVGDFFAGVWRGITNGLKAALNWAIDRINDATGIISRAWTWTGAPGIPKIPHLAKGGTALAGRMHLVGERGPELFIPGQTGRVVSNQQTFGGPQVIELTLDLGAGITERMRLAIDQNTGQVRRLAGAGTGSMR
ncbi:hypothetical protein DMP23_00270 [Amycolatopsis sp. A1MSW2902]|uniref:phage tail protein n=2 Tax=Amycolatopsis sp. A1MSW2902 TaxID=687413 RepID=UPI00307F306A